MAKNNELALTTVESRSIIDDKVRNMILKGSSRAECLKFIAKESKRLGVEHAESTCSTIYHQVKTAIKSELSDNREEIVSDIASKLYFLYGKNFETGDLKECRECLKEIAKLAGINSGNSVEINKIDDTIKINFGFSD